jgi:hypothetical protein
VLIDDNISVQPTGSHPIAEADNFSFERPVRVSKISKKKRQSKTWRFLSQEGVRILDS